MRVDPARTIALLPVAAIEQHGPHLPLATDALINEGVLQRTLQRLSPTASVLVLRAHSFSFGVPPGLFELDELAHGLLGAEKPVGIAWMTQDLNAHGACGDATAASAAKGAAVLEHMATRLLQVLAEVQDMPLPGA